MINKISICIPFYETHDLTTNFLDSIVNEDFIDEIIISDDCSQKKFNYQNNKVKIYRNKINQGAFRNKYISVSKAKNQWVLLLDSDNFIDLDILKKIFKYQFRNNFFYLPKKLLLESVDNFGDEMHNKVIDYNFLKNNTIDLDSASNYLKKKNKKIEWLLNTGNFIIQKNEYIEVAKRIYEDRTIKFIDCDALVFTYLWLKNKKKIFILDFYFTRHRLRKDSWTNLAKNNWDSQKLHIFLIKHKGKYLLLYYASLLIFRLFKFYKNILKSMIGKIYKLV